MKNVKYEKEVVKAMELPCETAHHLLDKLQRLLEIKLSVHRCLHACTFQMLNNCMRYAIFSV